MKSVLVDTSVWVDHFRRGNEVLVNLLHANSVQTHPMIVAELTCGTPPAPRLRTLKNIERLQSAKQASLREVMDFVEREKLYGLGCGLVDLILLASTLITPNTELWTLDKRLASLAERFGVAYPAINLH
ncbi:MAG: VapC toxin family PIN domain ribonuclease [Burkholderiales bacterium]|nr:VapC toxin family PIN domain ribonuclease [Burkholderiales bacterium]